MLYYVTVATHNHPVLNLLKESVKKTGNELIVLGIEMNKTIGFESHGNLGLKLKLLNDYLNTQLNENDILLFIDAFDVVYNSTSTEDIINRFNTINKPILFGAENNCAPDGSLCNKYPDTNKPFSFLNSGLFIGYIHALRECFKNYEYIDEINDQLWWTHKFIERQDIIELDYNNILFLNCYGVSKTLIKYENNLITYLPTNAHPLFLHFNGTSKAILNYYAKIDPTPYFTYAGATEESLRLYDI